MKNSFKKSVLSLLTILVLIVSCLSTHPVVTFAATNNDYTFTTVDDETISSSGVGKDATILVFGSTECGNTLYTLREIAQSSWGADPNLKIVYIDIIQHDKNQVSLLKNTIGGNIAYCYDNGNTAISAAAYYYHLFQFSGTIYMPVTVIIDSQDTPRMVFKSRQTADTLYSEIQKIKEPTQSSDPANTPTPDPETRTAAKLNITVKYGQAEARTIQAMINELRTSQDAWYWNSDNTTKTECHDLNGLTYDAVLEKVAMQRALELVLSYDHTRPNKEQCFTAYEEFGAKSGFSGENIAVGYRSAEEVNNAWREDSEQYDGQGHRRNMLDSHYTSVGIGHVVYNGCDYWVEEFSSETNDTTATVANENVGSFDVDVSKDVIKSFSVNLGGNNTITLDAGSSIELNKLKMQAVMTNTWLDRPTDINPAHFSFSVQDTVTAGIQNGILTGQAMGTTNLIISNGPLSITMPITVNANQTATVAPSEPTTPSEPSIPSSPSAPSGPSVPSSPSAPSGPSAPSSPSIPSETTTPSAAPTPSATVTPTITPANKSLNKGSSFKDDNLGLTCKVTKKGATVSIDKVDKTATKIKIPDTIQYNNTTYKVTKINNKAFSGCTKLKSIEIGKNIQTIGDGAFDGCKNLKNITILTDKLTYKNVGTNAFRKINKKAVFHVPENKLSYYKKLIRKRTGIKNIKVQL